MTTIDKSKILNRIIYLFLILIIFLSSAYIVRSFASKKEAEEDRNLLNTIDVENELVEANVEKEDNTAKDNNKESENTENNEEPNKEEKSEEKIKKEKEAESKKRIAQVKKLKEEYKNIVGWIEIKDTHISYPVVQGKDNEFYLTHNYKGDNAERGAIFLDSNYNWNIKGNNLMIYGHYMINEEMFTDLTKYVEENYYKQHPIIRFTTDKEDAEYDIIAVFRSKVYNKNDDVFKYYNFMNSESEKEYNNFIKNIKQASLYDIKETAEYGDELITLTTCSYYTEDGRFVVVGRKSCHGDGDFWQLKDLTGMEKIDTYSFSLGCQFSPSPWQLNRKKCRKIQKKVVKIIRK
mgnify:CR=1 FL=1